MQHSAHIIHNDVKPDNLILQAGGLGLRLIDFGEAVDLELLPAGYSLRGDSGTRGYRCPMMVHDRPWTHEVDNYGAARRE